MLCGGDFGRFVAGYQRELGQTDHQLLTSDLDHFFGHKAQCINLHDALNLCQQPPYQPEIAAGDADNRRDCLCIFPLVWLQGDTPESPLFSSEKVLPRPTQEGITQPEPMAAVRLDSPCVRVVE